ncbi:MAG: hypothetical protein AAGD09_03600 [Cyanobacteria bacterium P01_F01_bin.56]
MLRAKGVENPSKDWFNYAALTKRKREVNKDISPATAQLWLDLKDKGCLPRWAENQLHEGTMRLAAI